MQKTEVNSKQYNITYANATKLKTGLRNNKKNKCI